MGWRQCSPMSMPPAGTSETLSHPGSQSALSRRAAVVKNQFEVFGLITGLRSVLSHLIAPGIHDTFDRRYGVRTTDYIEVTESDIDSPNRVHAGAHGATPERVMRNILRHLPIDPPQYTFVDLGSGMGRVVLLASELPFARVMGIELSPTYCSIAEENLRTYKGPRLCQNVAVEQGDVTDFEIPNGPTVYYMFSPFGLPVLERVLQRIRDSVLASPRRVLIAYCHNALGEELMREKGFVPILTKPLIQPYWSWALWEFQAGSVVECSVS